MPENDFEKNVQDKMGGFDLTPSADLWNKVESRIRKEKKRRFIFWWPLGLLFLGGGIGLAIWLTKNNSEKQSIPVAENKSINPSTGSKPAGDPVVLPNPINKENSMFEPAGIGKAKQPVELKQKTRAGKITTIPAGKNGEELTEIPDNKKDIAEVKEKTTEPEKIQADQKIIQPVEQKKDESIKETVSEEKQEVKPVPENKKIKAQQTKQWGFGLSAGKSAIVHNLGIGGARDYAVIQSGSPAQLATYQRGPVKRSFSFSAQVFRKQRLSPRLDLIASIGYQYLSSRLLTGERVDSSRLVNNYYSGNVAVSRFYRPYGSGTTTHYTNQFHFLNLGGELSWRFTGKKANIRWNNGLSYERLFVSSMLHYNGTLLGYYKDNSLLRKDHLFFNTSLSIPIGKKFELHPFASRSITSVLNIKDSATSKFSNLGLRVRYLFDKRK